MVQPGTDIVISVATCISDAVFSLSVRLTQSFGSIVTFATFVDNSDQAKESDAVKHSKRRNSHKIQTKIQGRLAVTVAYVDTHADVDAGREKEKNGREIKLKIY